MALRATLHRALCDFANTADGWAAAADDLAAAVEAAHQQVTALLGITEPADEDPQAVAYNTEPVGSPWEKAQLAAELASCDWEGWD